MHIGFQGFRQRLNTYASGSPGLAGQFIYDGKYTSGPSKFSTAGPNGSGMVTGIPEADFLLGLSGNITVGSPKEVWGQRANIFAAFFQQDWRLTDNLVVNFGLRYELHTPWYEIQNRQTNYGLYSGVVELAGQSGNSYYELSSYELSTFRRTALINDGFKFRSWTTASIKGLFVFLRGLFRLSPGSLCGLYWYLSGHGRFSRHRHWC